jgi:homoserine kinase type II
VALLTPMTLGEARAALAGHDLDVAAVQALTAGSVNSNFALTTKSGERFFVRLYEEQGFDGAAAELQMIRELAASGVPTPTPRARRDGSFVGEHRGKPLGVHPWIDGEILCFGRLTPEATRSLGRALARVHGCSPRLSQIPAGRFGLDGLRERLDRVDRTDPSYATATRRIRERLDYHAERSPSALPRGLIHGDLFRDNVLWRQQPGGHLELCALLDFESASAGIFIYDLMVCAHAWCYGQAFEPGLLRALFAGYQEERLLEPVELEAIAHQGALAALRFATTRLTDFSLRAAPGQQPARDYRRFLERLEAIENGIMSIISEEGSS